jgi:hypothetical protein
VENFYPKRLRIHPLVIIGVTLVGLFFTIQQEIVSIDAIKRNWRRLR